MAIFTKIKQKQNQTDGQKLMITSVNDVGSRDSSPTERTKYKIDFIGSATNIINTSFFTVVPSAILPRKLAMGNEYTPKTPMMIAGNSGFFSITLRINSRCDLNKVKILIITTPIYSDL